MITANEFDLVFDCQQVFKQLMQAMANPESLFHRAKQRKAPPAGGQPAGHRHDIGG